MKPNECPSTKRADRLGCVPRSTSSLRTNCDTTASASIGPVSTEASVRKGSDSRIVGAAPTAAALPGLASEPSALAESREAPNGPHRDDDCVPAASAPTSLRADTEMVRCPLPRRAEHRWSGGLPIEGGFEESRSARRRMLGTRRYLGDRPKRARNGRMRRGHRDRKPARRRLTARPLAWLAVRRRSVMVDPDRIERDSVR